jgi:hypothetical protein
VAQRPNFIVQAQVALTQAARRGPREEAALQLKRQPDSIAVRALLDATKSAKVEAVHSVCPGKGQHRAHFRAGHQRAGPFRLLAISD